MILKISLISIEKCTVESYYFFVNDTTLALDNPLRFRKKIFLTYIIKIMTINNQIRDKKLQYDINGEATKILALSSSKTRKYEYLTGEDILSSNHQ